jgi:hypothetical protein
VPEASTNELEAPELDWFADAELNSASHGWLGDADGDETEEEEEVDEPGDGDGDAEDSDVLSELPE